MKVDFTPTYHQIKQDIKRKIKTGKLKPGDLLPGRKPLADEYLCSWSTLNRAVNELILEGVLKAQKGKGTFIAELPPQPSEQTGVEPVKVWFCHPFPSVYTALSEMMEGMREKAHYQGRSIQFLDPVGVDSTPTNLNGYIIVTPSNDQFQLLQQAWNRGERFVVLNSDFDGSAFAAINADIYSGTFEACQYLLGQHHRNIGLLGIRFGFSNYERRIEAFRHAYELVGARFEDKWIVDRPEGRNDQKKKFIQWLKDHPECTAIFAADYTSALILLEVAEEKGIKVPEQLSVFAAGEAPSASMLKVSLSTMVQPFHELGQRAVSVVLNGEWDIGTELLTCTLKIRDSVKSMPDG